MITIPVPRITHSWELLYRPEVRRHSHRGGIRLDVHTKFGLRAVFLCRRTPEPERRLRALKGEHGRAEGPHGMALLNEVMVTSSVLLVLGLQQRGSGVDRAHALAARCDAARSSCTCHPISPFASHLCRTVITVEDDHALRTTLAQQTHACTQAHYACLQACQMRTPVWQVSLLIIDFIFHFLLPRTPTVYVRITMWQWHETSAPGARGQGPRPSRHRANANVCHEDRVSEMYAARRFERYADCTYV